MKFKIEQYNTNIGTFFKFSTTGYYHNSDNVFINSQKLPSLPKYTGDFYKVEGRITSVQHKEPKQQLLSHYELINPVLVSENIPLTFSIEEADEHLDDYEDHMVYSEKFTAVKSLYEKVYTTVPAKMLDAEVEFVNLGELQIDNFTQPEKVKVNVTSTIGFGDKVPKAIDLTSVVNYDQLTKMLVPEFMIHNHECSLTSEQVYKIVRQHIIENINPKVAVLSSNYDFCLTVKKIIGCKPYIVKKESFTRSNNSYKPPRFVGRTVEAKQVEIFEMTWAGYKGTGGYNDYTCIPAWKANNFQELVENMKQYLNDLMEVINAPATECVVCNGTGNIFSALISK